MSPGRPARSRSTRRRSAATWSAGTPGTRCGPARTGRRPVPGSAGRGRDRGCAVISRAEEALRVGELLAVLELSDGLRETLLAALGDYAVAGDASPEAAEPELRTRYVDADLREVP